MHVGLVVVMDPRSRCVNTRRKPLLFFKHDVMVMYWGVEVKKLRRVLPSRSRECRLKGHANIAGSIKFSPSLSLTQ